MSQGTLPSSSGDSSAQARGFRPEVVLRPADALVVRFKRYWDEGQRVSAQDFLAENADRADDKELIVDLAYEEYSRRVDAGEPLDPGEFAERFPRCRSSLRCLLGAHQFANDNPQYLNAWPQPDTHFHGFRIIEELGRGAFARVYLAHEVALGHRLVAIKVAYTGAAEGNILGQLAHANIVTIHSIQQHRSTGFTIVCMPFAGRATLIDVLDHAYAGLERPRRASVILDALAEVEHGRAPGDKGAPHALLEKGSFVDGVAHLGRQLARALAFVHKQKIYHRDLKPSNVLLTPDGTPMLLDFNLSAQEGAPAQLLGGTITYMSPEQLRATDPDYQGPPCLLAEPADIFSLGVILFELLTGEHPFGPIPWRQKPDELRQTLLQRQPAGPRAIHGIDPLVDRRIARIIERCLAYDPRDRYASAGDLARDLDRYLSSMRRAVGKLVRHRLVRMAGLAAAAVMAVALVVAALRDPAEVREYKSAVQAFRAGEFARVVAHCDETLRTDPGAARALFLRGKARHQLGDFQAAINDYLEAEKTASPELLGPLYANLAYAVNRRPSPAHQVAAMYYDKALAAGFSNAAVFNNLAYSHLVSRGLSPELTASYLAKAVELDPRLQAAYHHQAKLDFIRTVQLQVQSSASAAGLEAIKKAVELGPPSAELFHDAARLHAKSAQPESALDYAEKAVEAGFPLKRLQDDFVLAGLRSHPRFQQLAGISVKPGISPPAIHFVDPAPNYFP